MTRWGKWSKEEAAAEQAEIARVEFGIEAAPALVCAECGSPMHLRRMKRDDFLLYGCARFPQCVSHVRATLAGVPLAAPPTKAQREMREAAHAACVRIWKDQSMCLTQFEVLSWIALSLSYMALPEFDLLDEEDCKLILDLCARRVALAAKLALGTKAQRLTRAQVADRGTDMCSREATRLFDGDLGSAFGDDDEED